MSISLTRWKRKRGGVVGRKESSPRLTLGRAPLAAGEEVELGAEKGASTFPPQERLWRLVSFFFKISAWRGNCRLQAGTLLPSPPGAQPNASLSGRGLSIPGMGRAARTTAPDYWRAWGVFQPTKGQQQHVPWPTKRKD